MNRNNVLNSIHIERLERLSAFTGTYWQDVKGEFHLAYSEFPTWILLYEDSDLKVCHEAFCEVVRPLMTNAEPMQFTVSYLILTEALEISVDTFMDNQEVLEALEAEAMGVIPETNARTFNGLFGSQISTLRPIE